MIRKYSILLQNYDKMLETGTLTTQFFFFLV
jgi:hypothetical protein